MLIKKICFLLLFCWNWWWPWVSLSSSQEKNLIHVQERRVLMGTSVDIQVLARTQKVGQEAVVAAMTEIQRIEALMSTYRPDSEIQRVNNMAGRAPVTVSSDTWRVVKKAVHMCRLTKGAFDITYKPLWLLWQQSGTNSPPTRKDILTSLKLVDSGNIIFSEKERTLYLTTPGMKLDLGGIAKGYAVDCALEVLKQKGIRDAVVNAGGDLRAMGRNRGRSWTAGIRHPRSQKDIIATLPIDDEALVTSGDYERYLIIKGKKYAHIIDPRTGYPVEHMISVTVIAPTAMEADAFSTALFVLGPQAGISLLNSLPGLEALLIDNKGALYFTKGLTIPPPEKAK